MVEIVASAKNKLQKNSSDDDDLRLAIDDYHFGKYDPVWLGIQMADVLEKHEILKNFEIEIQILDTLSLSNE